MTTAESLREWYRRAHIRLHDRPAETNGPNDLGAHAGCTCPAEIDTHLIEDARRRATSAHDRYRHPGPADACQSPHDVLCKAVWP